MNNVDLYPGNSASYINRRQRMALETILHVLISIH